MTDIQAAIGIHQLRKIDQFTCKRRKIAERYNEAFSEYPEIILPPGDTDFSEQVYHFYAIRLVLDRLTITRDQFVEALRAENIGTSVHFIPLHLHPFCQKEFGLKKHDFPIAESIFESVISLPIYPIMTNQDVTDVINAVDKIIRFCR